MDQPTIQRKLHGNMQSNIHKYDIMKKNGGIARARNYGLNYAREESDGIIFLDHDDIWKTDCLKVLSSFLEKDKCAPAAHVVADIIDENGQYMEYLSKNDIRRVRLKRI